MVCFVIINRQELGFKGALWMRSSEKVCKGFKNVLRGLEAAPWTSRKLEMFDSKFLGFSNKSLQKCFLTLLSLRCLPKLDLYKHMLLKFLQRPIETSFMKTFIKVRPLVDSFIEISTKLPI